MSRQDLRRRSWRRAARTIAATVIAVVGAGTIGGTASACDGPLLTAREAFQTADRIALVRVAAIRGDPALPDGYDLVLEEAYRGSLPPVLQIAAPQYHACGDRIVAAPGERLVILFGVEAFEDQPPLSPFWRVGPDEVLSADGIDARELGWTSLDQLRAGLTGAGGEGPLNESRPPEPSLGILLGLLVAAGVTVFGLAYLVRR